MRRLILFLMLLGSFAYGQPNSQVFLSTPAPPGLQANQIGATLVGTQGTTQYFYWVVAKYGIGNAAPGGPMQVGKANATLSGSNYVTISWQGVSGATGYDVLRTTTRTSPTGTCACAVATAVSGNSTNDQSNSLSAYTVNTVGQGTAVINLDNQSSGGPIPQISINGGASLPLLYGTNSNSFIVGDFFLLGQLIVAYQSTQWEFIANDFKYETTGNENFFLGHNAGNIGITTVGGYDNVAVGVSTLSSLGPGAGMLIGQANTAVGSYAGQAITNGAYNTILGYDSGDQLSTGTYNTILGVESGNTLTTGNYNVIIGKAADLASSTQIDEGVAIGYGALIGADGAVAIGYGVTNSVADSVNIGTDSKTMLTLGAEIPVLSLPTCAAGYLGAIMSVSDSNTNAWGATVATGGANHVGVRCNGSAWIVFAK